MGHQHAWQKEPPDGIIRTSDERYGDKRDLAHNSFWTSPEEIQELRLVLKKDPDFENSTDWPMVVEWCSSCAITRVVKLVLSEEEIKVLEPALEVERSTTDIKMDEKKTICDVCTQTPRQKPRRRGGRGSRTRRMLAYQLMLTVKRGLPLSRLLSNQKTDARSSKVEFQEEFSSPPLKVKEEVVIKKEEEEVAKVEVKEEREEADCPRERVPTSESSIFTLRNSQSGANPTSTQPHSISPFSVPPPPLFTSPPFPLFQTPQYCQMPAANWGFCGGCRCWGPVIPILAVQ